MTILYLAIIATLGACLILWWYMNTARVEIRVDQTRQRLFALRDDLFDSAARGEVSFESEAYQLTRQTLNGVIRFCEDLTFFRFLVFSWYIGPHKKQLSEEYSFKIETAFRQVPENQKAVLEKTRTEMHMLVMLHMIECSFLLTLLVRGFALAEGFKASMNKFVFAKYQSSASLSKKLDSIDAEATFLEGCYARS